MCYCEVDYGYRYRKSDFTAYRGLCGKENNDMNNFAGNGENVAGGAAPAANNAETQSQSSQGQQTPQEPQTPQTDSSGKTFTQEQLNALLASEKRDGKKSILKSLGFESEEDAKKQLAEFKVYRDSQKTAEQRYSDDMKAEQAKTAKALDKALDAEIKLSVVTAGGSADAAAEIAVLVKSEMREDEKLTADEAVKQVKEKLPQLFSGADAGNGSTGSRAGHVNIPAKSNYGKSLAERRVSSSAGKTNPYFKKG